MVLLTVMVSGFGKDNESANGTVVYELSKYTVSSSGGLMTGNVYSVTSSIGQIDAGHNTTGGNYEFDGG